MLAGSRFPGSWVSRFPDSQVSRWLPSIQELAVSFSLSRFSDFQVSRFNHFWVYAFLGSQVCSLQLPGSQVSMFAGACDCTWGADAEL